MGDISVAIRPIPTENAPCYKILGDTERLIVALGNSTHAMAKDVKIWLHDEKKEKY